MSLQIHHDPEVIFPYRVKTEEGDHVGAGMTEQAAWQAAADSLYDRLQDGRMALENVIEDLKI